MSIKIKLDDNLLDEIISEIAKFSLDVVKKHSKTKLSPTDEVEYLARAYTEILSVIIVSCPKEKTSEIYQNVCNFLQRSISVNEKMENLLGVDPEKNMKTKFEDILYTAKKGEA